MNNPDLLEISINPAVPRNQGETEGARVHITTRPFELVELMNRFDATAENQAILLTEVSQIKLGRLLDVNEIEFLQDGRWRLSLRATRAEFSLLG